MQKTLPPNPPGIGYLNDEQASELRARFSASQLPPPERCITCGGTGSFRWFDLDARDEIHDWSCDCVAQWVAYRWFLYAGIGLRQQRLAWADVGIDATLPGLGQVLDMVENHSAWQANGDNLLIRGPADSGKSMLAVLALKRLVACEGWSGRYATVFELLDEYTSTWGHPEQMSGFRRRYMGVDLLVIDDLGKEVGQRQELVQRALVEVLIYRYRTCLPTVVVSHRDLHSLAADYPELDMAKSFDSVTLPPSPAAGEAIARFRRAATDGLRAPVVAL